MCGVELLPESYIYHFCAFVMIIIIITIIIFFDKSRGDITLQFGNHRLRRSTLYNLRILCLLNQVTTTQEIHHQCTLEMHYANVTILLPKGVVKTKT